MFKNNIPQGVVKYILLVLLTIGCTYFAPKSIASIWYLLTLVLYYRSKDEPFWLVFYLVTTDGFMGFFGLYAVTIQAIPGLPAVELSQFYILLSFIKAIQTKKRPYVFYNKYISVLFFYIIFLIAWGQMMGFSGELNVYFRVIKNTLPFLLFYSIPILFREVKTYERLFSFIFVVLILAFFTQIFELITGLNPALSIRLTEEQTAEAGEFRTFYNGGATLLGLFGALFFLTNRERKSFSPVYLFIVISAACGMAFLSATRGWIISFGFIVTLSLLLTNSIKIKWRIGFILVLIILVFIGMLNSKIREQLLFSETRVFTIETLARGDITAGGTLQRLDIRSPKVIKVWRESPFFGWGFSDTSKKYGDGHVGNQNLLMLSGIFGFVLLMGFLIYFSYKMLSAYMRLSSNVSFRNVFSVFVIFLMGWFIIHSSSGQQFSYSGLPLQIIPQAVFFSLGALVYSKSKERRVNG